jgi:ERCC4-type nuclease
MRSIPRTAQDIGKAIMGYKLKPFKFPDGMIVLQDTREQTPLFGSRLPKGLVLCSATLKDGDYSIQGFQDKIAIERKGISDLLSYCTVEREKTKAKMERFRKMDFVALVVESRESDLYRPYMHSSISPEVIRQALVSFQVRYGVHVYIGVRENLSRYVLDIMIKYYRVQREL